MSEQYSYPTAPKTNPPAAYPAAAKPQQKQRSGPIIVGASAKTASAKISSSKTTSTKTTTSSRSAAASSSSGSGSGSGTKNKQPPPAVAVGPPPPGQGANECLAILGAYGKKRKAADSLSVLERLVPPLFMYDATSSIKIYDHDDGENNIDDCRSDEQDGKDECEHGSKKRRGDGESSSKSNDVTGEPNNNDRSDKEKQSTNRNDSDNSKIEYLKQLQKELEKYKQQNRSLMDRRTNVFKSMVALHEMYETGLDGIARMNDLRFVPDNVMPDKIPR